MGEGYLPRSHLPSGGGTVRSVVPITAEFQSESALHPAARAALSAIFERGWADPSKIHPESRRTAILLEEAKQTFSTHLGVRSDEIHFLSDVGIGFHLGIAGLVHHSETRFIHSAVDRQEIFAQSHHLALSGHKTEVLPVSSHGQIEVIELDPNSVLAWQLGNGETGIVQKQSPPPSRLFVDATASGTQIALPGKWQSALWDSRSWFGPSGLAILAISHSSSWRNPLPHLDPRKVSDSFSIPLVLASAIALEHWAKAREENSHRLKAMKNQIIDFVSRNISDVDFASERDEGLAHLLSFSFLYVDAERLTTDLSARGFSVDSGSACTSLNLQPSHVLAAMGKLTHGNIRLYLRTEVTDEALNAFLFALQEVVETQRR